MTNSKTTRNFAPTEAVSEQSYSENIHILLVDHDTIFRNLMQFCLEKLGYAVSVADGGKAALTITALSQDIQLLFTDIVMPGMSGVELAQKLRATHPRLEVLCMSGRPRAAIPEMEVTTDSIHFLQKPFGFTELDDRIKIILATGFREASYPIKLRLKSPV